MTDNIAKFIAEVKSRLDANNGKIPAPLYFDIGKECGLKCREVVDAKKEYFSDQTKKTVSAKSVSVKKIVKDPAVEIEIPKEAPKPKIVIKKKPKVDPKKAKLIELESDLETHEKSLIRLQDPDFKSKAHRGKVYDPTYDMNPEMIIPSYIKIIKSIKDEIKTLKKTK